MALVGLIAGGLLLLPLLLSVPLWLTLPLAVVILVGAAWWAGSDTASATDRYDLSLSEALTMVLTAGSWLPPRIEGQWIRTTSPRRAFVCRTQLRPFRSARRIATSRRLRTTRGGCSPGRPGRSTDDDPLPPGRLHDHELVIPPAGAGR